MHNCNFIEQETDTTHVHISGGAFVGIEYFADSKLDFTSCKIRIDEVFGICSKLETSEKRIFKIKGSTSKSKISINELDEDVKSRLLYRFGENYVEKLTDAITFSLSGRNIKYQRDFINGTVHFDLYEFVSKPTPIQVDGISIIFIGFENLSMVSIDYPTDASIPLFHRVPVIKKETVFIPETVYQMSLL
jgi:hypothetical protein